MTLRKVKEAVAEASRFLDKAEVVMNSVDKSRSPGATLSQSKNNSALRRSSLDLSRALAELRKSDYGV